MTVAARLRCKGCGAYVTKDDLLDGYYADGHLVDLPFELAMERGYGQEPCGPVVEVED